MFDDKNTNSPFDFTTFTGSVVESNEKPSVDETLNETNHEENMMFDKDAYYANEMFFDDEVESETDDEAVDDDMDSAQEKTVWTENLGQGIDLFGSTNVVENSDDIVESDVAEVAILNSESEAEVENEIALNAEPVDETDVEESVAPVESDVNAEAEKTVSNQSDVTYVKPDSSDDIIAEWVKKNPTNTLNLLNINATVFEAEHKNGIHPFNYYQNIYAIPATKAELYQAPYKSFGSVFTLLYIYVDSNNQAAITQNPTSTSKVIGMFTSTTTVDKLPDKPDLHNDIVISPFVIVGFVENKNGNSFGPLLRYISKSGNEKLLHLPSTDIEANKHIKTLVDNGFYISDDAKVRETFKKFLTGHYKKIVKYRVPYVDKLGYSNAHHGFYTPDGVLHTADGEKFTWFDCGEDHLVKVTPKGSFQGWQDNVAKVVVPYPLTAFSLMTAFGAPFLQLLKLNTMFFHYYGRSSKGKTTLLQIPISVFANGADPNFDPEGSFIDKWNTTTAGLELKARIYNGGIAAFDELHMCDDNQFKDATYTVCSGTSKTKANGGGGMQKQFTWKFLALSSGEQSGVDKTNQAGKGTLGQFIRFCDIHVKGQIFTDFDGNVMDDKSAEQLAFNLKEQCGLNFGHAGRLFINKLLNLADTKEALVELITVKKAEMFAKLTTGIVLGTEEMRVMHHLAMIAAAADFAIQFEILPMTRERAMESIFYVKNLWLDEMKHFHQQKAKSEDAVTILKEWLIKNKDNFVDIKSNQGKASSKGYHSAPNREHPAYYLIRGEVFKDIFKGQKIHDVCEELEQKGFLATSDQSDDQTDKTKRYQIARRVNSVLDGNGESSVIRFHAITADILVDEVSDEVESKVSQPMTLTLTPEMMAMMQQIMAAQQPA